MKKNKYTAAVIAFFSVLLVGCAALGITALATTAATDKDKICSGVYIDTVDVGGMTAEQAKSALDSYVESRENKSLIIQVADKSIETNLNDLGYSCNENDYIEQALKVGKSGNLIKRYKELKDIEEEKLVYELEFQLDNSKLKKLVEKKCSKFNIKAKNATMTRENGAFVYTDEKVGRKVVVEDTIEKIISMVEEEKDEQSIVVDAVVIEDIPQYDKESLSKIDDVIGAYSTVYHDSSTSRATNLANGAKFINGTTLYPGETFSCYEHMNPFTADNGYMPAGAYLQGKVVDSIGGGVCQVSSTLYNAVLRAELEIVERAPHSMAVGYVKAAADAAIAGTYKDLKFKNNLDSPIYIEAYTQDRTITFTIYGDEKRDIAHRTIDFVSEVTATIAPPKEVVTEDPTRPPSYRSVTQSAHTGMKANLYKVVYLDGAESERILVNSSSYAAAPQYVTVGTKEEEKKDPEQDPDDKDDKDSKNDKKPSDTGDKKPSDSKKPGTEEDIPADDVPVEDDEITDNSEITE